MNFSLSYPPPCEICGKPVATPSSLSLALYPSRCLDCTYGGAEKQGPGISSTNDLHHYQSGYDDGWKRAMRCVADMLRAGVSAELVRKVAEDSNG